MHSISDEQKGHLIFKYILYFLSEFTIYIELCCYYQVFGMGKISFANRNLERRGRCCGKSRVTLKQHSCSLCKLYC